LALSFNKAISSPQAMFNLHIIDFLPWDSSSLKFQYLVAVDEPPSSDLDIPKKPCALDMLTRSDQ
jgi:hypothetical protein